MARRSFLYYLFSASKKPLYVDDNGFVQEGDGNWNKANGQPAHLSSSPDGWRDVLVKYARNIKYWGLFRDMTVPMKFVNDGAAILRNRMWAAGIEAITYFGVAKLDRTESAYNYRSWYLSEINYAKYNESETTVTVEALEGGLSKYLKANENTQYEIEIDTNPDYVNVLFDGVALECKLNYTQYSYSSIDDETKGLHLPPVVFTNGEGTKINIVPNDSVILPVKVSASYYQDSTDYFLKAFAQTTIRIHGTIVLLPYAGGGVGDYTLRLRTSRGRMQEIFTGYVAAQAFNATFDSTFTVNADENVFLEANWTGYYPIVYSEGSFAIEFKNKFKPTYAKGLYPYTLLEKLVEKMTDGKYTIQSAWLKNLRSLVILSGDSIRGLSGAVIKTSFSDFFKSLNHYCIGMTIANDRLSIAPLGTFFNNSTAIMLGQVKDATIEPAEDLFFNTIKCGGKTVDYEDVNGRYECNQTQSWSTPITKVVKEHDLTTPYRRDPYGIEFTRMNLEGKTTTDSKSDNDTFMVNIQESIQYDQTPHYKLNRPAYNPFSGVPDTEGIFNVELSPKRSLLNNGAYIRSIMDYLDAQKIKQTSADKNKDLVAGAVAEKEDIQIGGLKSPLFKPYYFHFTTDVPDNILALIDTNPYGKVQFTWNNRQWYGWLMDGGIKPATQDVQKWQLLCSPENDLSKFN